MVSFSLEYLLLGSLCLFLSVRAQEPNYTFPNSGFASTTYYTLGLDTIAVSQPTTCLWILFVVFGGHLSRATPRKPKLNCPSQRVAELPFPSSLSSTTGLRL